MKLQKKEFCVFLALLLAFVPSTLAWAYEDYESHEVPMVDKLIQSASHFVEHIAKEADAHTDSAASDFIHSVYLASAQDDINGLVNLFSEAIIHEAAAVFHNLDNQANHIGLLNIIEAEIVNISTATVDQGYINDLNFESISLRAYLVAVNLQTYVNNSGFYNGINYHYFILSEEADGIKLVVMTAPSATVLEESGISNDLAWELVYNRYYIEHMSIAPFGISDPVTASGILPSTIKVLRTDKNPNVIESIPFTKYCYGVLYQEMAGVISQTEALRAGAVAAKMLGWFRILQPKYSGLGYDVKSDTNDQHYVDPPTSTAGIEKYENAVKPAVDHTINVRMLSSDNKFFEVYYKQGTSGEHNSSGSSAWNNAVQYGGCMSQYGAQKNAQEGRNYQYILHYYYDKSSTVSMQVSCISSKHTQAAGWGINTNQHWKKCIKCDVKLNIENHDVYKGCSICNTYIV